MEEWIDSGSSSNGREEGEEGEEGESPIQPNTSHLTADDDLGGILTQQELEENFDLRVDCFSDLDTPDEEDGECCDSTTRGAEQVPSDLQPCERRMCQKTTICSAEARDSNQTSRPLRIAESVDTPPFVQPAPPSNTTTNTIAPDPSPHVTGETSDPIPPVGRISVPSVGRISTIDTSGPSPHVTGETSVPSHGISVPSGPTPPVGRISTIDMSAHSLRVAGKVSGSSPPGVILVSSREVTYSQVS